MDFGNFLRKMSSQTGANLRLPDSEEIVKRNLEEQQPAPVRVPKSLPPDEPTPVRQQKPEDREDTVERIFEATSAILKTLRQAFPNKDERMMAYESLQNAIGMTLNEGMPVRQVESRRVEPKQSEPPARSKKASPQRPLTEKEEFIIPRQNMALEGMEYNNDVASSYNRHIDIKPGQGLSGVSEQDLADLKALAGI